MASTCQRPRDPAEIRHRVVLSREQRDWINAAAGALEQHAGMTSIRVRCSRPPPSCAASSGSGISQATRSRQSSPQERLRAALRQIADADSGAWGWIARRALDEAEVHP